VGVSPALIGGDIRPFALPIEPPQHTFICGRTGTGKTTLLTRIQSEYFRVRLPFLAKDFHGTVTDDLLGLGQAASTRLVLLEPWANPVIGWNPLDTGGDSPYAVVQELIAIFHHRLWPDAWGPRLEELLRQTLLSLVEARLTLLEATSFLSRSEFRRATLRHVSIPEVREFWTLRFERLSPSQRALITETVLNKLSVFHDPALKYVVGQQSGTLDLGKTMARQETIIANLSSGKLRGNNFLLAALLVAKFKNEVYRRPPGARPYAVFLDEFQEMVALESLDDYLRSFRKFGCSVYLATQHLDLPPALKAAVFSNCSRFVCFAASTSDAAYLGREFGGAEGALVADLLPELPRGQAIVKIRGSPARLLCVEPVPKPSPDLISRGRLNAMHLGRLRAEIDAEIERRRARIAAGHLEDLPQSRDTHDDKNSLPEGYSGL